MASESNLPITPLTMKEIDDFLVQTDRKKCPWCDGVHWGMHIDGQGGTLLTGPNPGLRAFPRVRITKKEDGSGLHGEVEIGPDASLVSVVAECQECGHLTFFSYFTIMRLIRKKGEE